MTMREDHGKEDVEERERKQDDTWSLIEAPIWLLLKNEVSPKPLSH